jgi:hypothetical protein
VKSYKGGLGCIQAKPLVRILIVDSLALGPSHHAIVTCTWLRTLNSQNTKCVLSETTLTGQRGHHLD